MTSSFDIVIPTIGRPSLGQLLEVLAEEIAEMLSEDDDELFGPEQIIIVDDRPGGPSEIPLASPSGGVQFLRSYGRGPAAARNLGWQCGAANWVCFLDDDVIPEPGWLLRLRDDLRKVGDDEVAIQGRVVVPLPSDREPNDIELNTAKLEHSAWITADMVIRRDALALVGGFDERFRRAYREDTDLALRMMDLGLCLKQGERTVRHPAHASNWWSSVRAQRGNADDALMKRLHGPDWRRRGASPAGLLPQHRRTTLALAAAVATARVSRALAALAGLVWLKRWNDFRRLRTTGSDGLLERFQLGITSAVIPPAATAWSLLGYLRARKYPALESTSSKSRHIPEVVMFDRDGTLVVDVPYNGDPDAVVLMPGAEEAIQRLREAGVLLAMITNQSGVSKGLIDLDQVAAVNQRVEELVGGFDVIKFCPHGDRDGCGCRKPLPGMIFEAAKSLGVDPSECAVVGDIGSDVEAAIAAGARPILVPNERTRAAEILSAPEVVPDLTSAVSTLLNPMSSQMAIGRL